MSVNVTDRPMTGQGVMGMRTAAGGGRLVEDTSYYVGLLRKKMKDVSNETTRLRSEIEEMGKKLDNVANDQKEMFEKSKYKV